MPGYLNAAYTEQNRKLLILLCRKNTNFRRMTQGFFHDARPFTKILLVAFLMVTCYLIFFGMGIILSMPLFKTAPGEVIRILESNDVEANIGLLKFLQVNYSTKGLLTMTVKESSPACGGSLTRMSTRALFDLALAASLSR